MATWAAAIVAVNSFIVDSTYSTSENTVKNSYTTRLWMTLGFIFLQDCTEFSVEFLWTGKFLNSEIENVLYRKLYCIIDENFSWKLTFSEENSRWLKIGQISKCNKLLK